MEDEIVRQMREQGFEVEESDVEENVNLLDTLTENAIKAVNLFKVLPDIFVGAGMGGVFWIGKDLASLEYIMELLNIYKDRVRIFELFQICCIEYSTFMNKQLNKGSK